jgi:hypothetical protein
MEYYKGLLLGLYVGIFLGIWLGSAVESKRWRSNADQPMRICQKGRFYKVFYDED